MSSGGEVTSVRVALRVRPQSAAEKIAQCRECVARVDHEPQIVLGKDRCFTYDYVFDTATQQRTVYGDCVADLVRGCFDGKNATVLAYGQTGSGKTYTMGTGFDESLADDKQGVVPRAVEEMFALIKRKRADADVAGLPAPQFSVEASFIELYNEELKDLLSPAVPGANNGRPAIAIREDRTEGMYIAGLATERITSKEDMLACLHRGSESRTTHSTSMNAQSSRSHAIFTVHLSQRRPIASTVASTTSTTITTTANEGNPSGTESNGGDGGCAWENLKAKFHFVDLAGSERLKRTKAEGARAREGISINVGLLALGNVISALGDTSKKALHVPYRDSKLTRLLQDSLGGNSRTLMIACISPSDSDFVETLSTLKYANRARNIKNKVVVNQDSNALEIAQLRREIQSLKLEVMEYKTGMRAPGQASADDELLRDDMRAENAMLAADVARLKTQVTWLNEKLKESRARIVSLETAGQAERFASVSAGVSVGAGDATAVGMIESYVNTIETLRAQLADVGAPAGTFASSSPLAVPSSPSSAASLSKAARRRQKRQNQKQKLKQLKMQEDEDRTVAAVVGGSAAESSTTTTTTTTDAHGVSEDTFSKKKKKKKTEIKKNKSTEGAEEGMTNGSIDRNRVGSQADDEIAETHGEDDAEEEEEGEDDEMVVMDATDEDRLNNDDDDDDDDNDNEEEEEEDDDNDDDDDDDDNDDDDDGDCMSTADEDRLESLNAAIEMRETLLRQMEVSLETTQHQLSLAKKQYQDKLTVLQDTIRHREEERNKVMANLESVSSVSAEEKERMERKFKAELTNLRGEVVEYKKLSKEQARWAQLRERNEREIKALHDDLQAMKRQKVQLMTRIKEDSKRQRDEKQALNKQMSRIRKEKQQEETRANRLEATVSRRDTELKKSKDERALLERQLRDLKSSTTAAAAAAAAVAASSSSGLRPVPAVVERLTRRSKSRAAVPNLSLPPPVSGESLRRMKGKRQQLEKEVPRLALRRETQAELEKLHQTRARLVKARDALTARMSEEGQEEGLTVSTSDTAASRAADVEDLEGIVAELDYVGDRIQSMQADLLMSDADDGNAVAAIIRTCSRDDARYLLDSFFNVVVDMELAHRKRQSRVKELEKKLRARDEVQSSLRHSALGAPSLVSSLVAVAEPSLLPTPSPSSSPPSAAASANMSAPSAVPVLPILAQSRTAAIKTPVMHTDGPSVSSVSSSPLQAMAQPNPQPTDTVAAPFSLAPAAASDTVVSQRASLPSTGPPRTGTAAMLAAFADPTTATVIPSTTAAATTSTAVMMPTDSDHSAPTTPSQPPPLGTPVMSGEAQAFPEVAHLKAGSRLSTPSTQPNAPSLPVEQPASRARTVSRAKDSKDVFLRLTPDSSGAISTRGSWDATSAATPATQTTTTTTSSSSSSSAAATSSSSRNGSTTSVHANANGNLVLSHTASGHGAAVKCVAALGGVMVSGSQDATVKVWDVQQGRETMVLSHGADVRSVTLGAPNVLYTASQTAVRMWDLRTASDSATRILQLGSSMQAGAVYVNSERPDRLFVGAGKALKVVDTRQMSTTRTIQPHASDITAICASRVHDHDYVVSGSRDHTVRAYDLQTGELPDAMVGHYDGVQALISYRKWVFSGSRDKTMKRWQVGVSGRETAPVAGGTHPEWVCALAALPQLDAIASADRLGCVRLWRPSDLSMLAELNAHKATINSMAVDADCLFTASSDRTVRVWRVPPQS